MRDSKLRSRLPVAERLPTTLLSELVLFYFPTTLYCFPYTVALPSLKHAPMVD